MAESAPLWSLDAEAVLTTLKSARAGLSQEEAARRLIETGPNTLASGRRFVLLRLVWAQVANPLVLILLFAAIVSMVAREWTDAAVVTTIVVLSSVIGFWREYGAGKAVEQLRAHRLEEPRLA